MEHSADKSANFRLLWVYERRHQRAQLGMSILRKWLQKIVNQGRIERQLFTGNQSVSVYTYLLDKWAKKIMLECPPHLFRV